MGFERHQLRPDEGGEVDAGVLRERQLPEPAAILGDPDIRRLRGARHGDGQTLAVAREQRR
jgi:hypothetical protein